MVGPVLCQISSEPRVRAVQHVAFQCEWPVENIRVESKHLRPKQVFVIRRASAARIDGSTHGSLLLRGSDTAIHRWLGRWQERKPKRPLSTSPVIQNVGHAL